MNDQVIDPVGADADCPARGPSGEMRVALPSADAVTTLAEAREAIDGLDAALATPGGSPASSSSLMSRTAE
ncbi:hypothetical protein GCM10023178_49740 [Actinomadura luteofluorescens]